MNYFLSRLCEAYQKASPELGPTELSRSQKIALCHTFGVRDFAECVISFIGDPKDFCTKSVHEYIAQYNSNYTNGDIAWQEVRQFHHDGDEKNAFIHRVLLLNGQKIEKKSEDLWNHTMNWFQMKHFSSTTQSNQWEEFKRYRFFVLFC